MDTCLISPGPEVLRAGRVSVHSSTQELSLFLMPLRTVQVEMISEPVEETELFSCLGGKVVTTLGFSVEGVPRVEAGS